MVANNGAGHDSPRRHFTSDLMDDELYSKCSGRDSAHNVRHSTYRKTVAHLNETLERPASASQVLTVLFAFLMHVESSEKQQKKCSSTTTCWKYESFSLETTRSCLLRHNSIPFPERILRFRNFHMTPRSPPAVRIALFVGLR